MFVFSLIHSKCFICVTSYSSKLTTAYCNKRIIVTHVKVKIYKTIILPVVLYECETWSVTVREEHRLRVFENRVLRRIFGPKRGAPVAL
jgi:hypothetical protein